MQDVAWVNANSADILAAGQRPLMQLWIEVLGAPVEISNLEGKNYLKDISFSSGGARMTPNPIAGQFTAIISNEGNIFHPNHPTSLYRTYFKAGTKVWIKLGGNYPADPAKYWQRIIGYMDEPDFSTDTFELVIKGLDYMRVLSDIKFTKEIICSAPGCSYTPIDNYWGTKWEIVSEETAPLGDELYNPSVGVADEGDAAEIGVGEQDDPGAWVIKPGFNGGCSITSELDVCEFSDYELEFIADPGNRLGIAWYESVCDVEEDEEYSVTFKYTRIAGTQGGALRLTLCDPGPPVKRIGGSGFLDPETNNDCKAATFQFTAPADATLDLWMVYLPKGGSPSVATWRVDEISIKKVLSKKIIYYDMPEYCTGIYYVELDGEPVWPGKQSDPGEGWYYDVGTNRFWFDGERAIAADLPLHIYYFTAQAPENVLADILVKAGLYVNRAVALADMGGPVTGVSVDRVWFKDGSAYIDAIKKICERSEPSGWRFYFDWNGKPVFVPAPVAGVPVFTTFNPQHFTSPRLYQDRNEIRNRIVIEGEKRAELTGWEDNMPSELKDEASDPGSITAYGEHTKSIKNHLFQIQASITAMCATLLAAYKDPKWYFDFDTPYNAVPLELGDTVEVQELLDIALPVAQRHITHTCLIRNADVSRYNVTYKCEIEGEGMIELLASIDDIDLNALGETSLYTVPAGRGCIITGVVMRNADGAVGTAEWSCGFNDGSWDDVIANAHRALAGATRYNVVMAMANAVRGAAAEIFKIDVNIAEGISGTLYVTVDVFGYLYWV